MDKLYLVVSPVLYGKFHQDELLIPSQLNDAVKLLAKGAIREPSTADIDRLNNVILKVFILLTDANSFASWMATITGTNQICPESFRPELGWHMFPIGDGEVSAERSDPIAVPNVNGYLSISIHSGYHNVRNIKSEELQKHEPVSFRILALSSTRIRVQARCGIAALFPYFSALISQIQVRWPDADLQSIDHDDRKAKSPRQPLVISVHGIRTRGDWQIEFGKELKDAGFAHEAINYGFFGALKLLWKPTREKQLRWFRDQYTTICDRYGDHRPSVVAHSFGTYLTAESISVFGTQFDTIILCGSIVVPDFEWSEVRGHRSQVTGHRSQVTGHRSQVTGHSDYFYLRNYRNNWIPFLRGGSTYPPFQSVRLPNIRFRITAGLIGLALILIVIFVILVARSLGPKPFNPGNLEHISKS